MSVLYIQYKFRKGLRFAKRTSLKWKLPICWLPRTRTLLSDMTNYLTQADPTRTTTMAARTTTTAQQNHQIAKKNSAQVQQVCSLLKSERKATALAKESSRASKRAWGRAKAPRFGEQFRIAPLSFASTFAFTSEFEKRSRRENDREAQRNTKSGWRNKRIRSETARKKLNCS